MKRNLHFLIKIRQLLLGVVSLFFSSGMAFSQTILASSDETYFKPWQIQPGTENGIKWKDRVGSPLPDSMVLLQVDDLTISGTVEDVQGNPIPGVTVSVQGTN